MLVLQRKLDEQIHIGNDIVITVVGIGRDKVRIGVEAPREVAVWRGEIFEAIQRENEHGGGENT